MALFVNRYENLQNAHFSRIIHVSPNNNIFVGAADGKGIYGKFDDQGNLIFVKEFINNDPNNNDPFGFVDGVACDNGDFMLLGARTISSSRRHHLFVRVNSSGTVLWAKTVYHSSSRFIRRILKQSNDRYVSVAWNEFQGGSRDNIELVRMSGTGTVIATNLITLSTDDQPEDMINWPGNDDFVLVGRLGSGGSGLFLHIAANLQPQNGYRFGTSNVYDFLGITAAPASAGQSGPSCAIVGYNRSNGATIYMKLDNFSSPVVSTVKSYSIFSQGNDLPRNIMYAPDSQGNRYYYSIVISNDNPRKNRIVKLNDQMNIVFVKEIGPASEFRASHMAFSNATNEVLVSGWNFDDLGDRYGMILRLNDQLDACFVSSVQTPSNINLSLPRSTVVLADQNHQMTLANPSRTTETPQLQSADICCPKNLQLSSQDVYQSPYFYLQATGSDASDGSSEGYHLRWELMKELGEAHLPKGNLATSAGGYPTSIGFNRADDFVTVYKTLYDQNFPIRVDLSNPPNTAPSTSTTRIWEYSINVPLGGGSSSTTAVQLDFKDVFQYDLLQQTINPQSNPLDFIKAYGGEVEISIGDKLAFKIEVSLDWVNPSSSSRFDYEVISTLDRFNPSGQYLSLRNRYLATVPLEPIICENMELFRFACNNAYPREILIETYSDFIEGKNGLCEWETIRDDYSLDDGNSDSNAEVFRRLEDTSNYTVHNAWPKYNDTSGSEFRVNVANYQDRWSTTTDGLKQAVADFLTLSQTDLQANATLANNDPNSNNSAMQVSYLDMLNFVALDFHVARILGLGHIEGDRNSNPNQKWVFMAEYSTEASLPGVVSGTARHFHMSRPVSKVDHLKPIQPAVEPAPVYGLWVDNLTGNPTFITDQQGYAPFDDIRYINLYRKKTPFERDPESFFQTTTKVDLCSISPEAMFGVDYREAGGTYVKPEILNDPDYQDPSGINETMAIPNTGDLRLHTHAETNPGIHEYRLYSINWFSRPSVLSDPILTDNTKFPKRALLPPPSNFRVQLIQPEQTLMFTTSQEQLDLSAISGTDKTYARVNFDWNHHHNQLYQFADKAELFFRKDEPMIVRGALQSGAGAVVANTTTHIATVQTTSFTITSTNPAQTHTPVISSGDASRFVGGILVADGKSFLIDSIVSTGTNPTIAVKQIRETQTLDPNNNGQYVTMENWISPDPGAQFSIVEQLSDSASWDTKLVKDVQITKWSPTYTETVTHSDGTTQVLQMGGLTDNANVTDIPDPDPNITSFIPSGGPSSVPTGTYTITFNVKNLANHPQVDVDYFRGIVRIPDVNGDMKELQVWQIDNSGSTLKLVAFDPTFGLQRNPTTQMFILSAGQFVPMAGYIPVQTGNNILNNFHPSYRAYLYAESNAFNQNNILPALGESTRKTFMGIRAMEDLGGGQVCESYFQTPAILLARELRDPIAPGEPKGPLWATRPDFYGKSSYTFDVEVESAHSLIFYRANHRKVLEQLYKTETVQLIVEVLNNLDEYDGSFTGNRWSDLLNLVTDANDNFIEHTKGGFAFPIPDNADYVIPDADPSVVVKPFDNNTTPPGSSTVVSGTTLMMKEVVRGAMDGAFVPLTELPMVFDYINETDPETSGRKPKLKGPNGEVLTVFDNDFDPWPMAIRYELNNAGQFLQDGDGGYGNASNNKFVRFTDYSLSGASNDLYFYLGVELTNDLRVSDTSPINGPVSMLNSQPAIKPEIKKIQINLKDEGAGQGYHINFEPTAYNPGDGIFRFDLYRTTDPLDVNSIRFMTKVNSFSGFDKIVDYFDDLEFIPFAQPIYYRLMAFREIVNEQGEEEVIPSLPSKPAVANVIDIDNPPAPELTFVSDPLTPTAPIQYDDCKIKWQKVAHNSTYHLYKMDERGTWVNIYSVTTNAVEMEIDLLSTTLNDGTLLKVDSDDNTLYHQFRVVVVNSSGLKNLTHKVLTV